MTVLVMTTELAASSECVEMTVSVMTAELAASSECVEMTGFTNNTLVDYTKN